MHDALHNVTEAIDLANKVEQPEPTQVGLDGKRHIKALIITLTNSGEATAQARRLIKSIHETKSQINPLIMDASTPETAEEGLASITYKDFRKAQWTWPTESRSDGLDIRTGLYRKTYRANDQRKVIACMVSHMRAWQYCIDMNEPIMVLESDALFFRKFKWEQLVDPKPMKLNDTLFGAWKQTKELQVLPWSEKELYNNLHSRINKTPETTFTGGILGLNSPIGATRKSSVFHNALFGKYGFHKVPSVDQIGEDPLPQGIAGNSAYILKPWAAKKLLDKVEEIGMWPNDALMCKQFFPWMQVCWPYYTIVQGGRSTTTG